MKKKFTIFVVLFTGIIYTLLCTRRTMDLSTKTGEKNMKNLSEIYFAGGCFWEQTIS